MPIDLCPQSGANVALLQAAGLSKRYGRGGWLARNRTYVQALRNINFTMQVGTTLALVGPSGAGKSTLARCLAGLEEPDSGEILFFGKSVSRFSRGDLIATRRQIQLIFQDPASSLNRRFTALDIVSEPLLISRRGTKQERQRRALELMEQVGLSASAAGRLPFEFSAGQRRRLAIARALALEPKLLILDEALAGLDLSIQAQILNLLQQLQAAHALTYLHIAHDPGMVAHVADEILVLREGQIVECVSRPQALAGASWERQSLVAATGRLP